MGGKEGEGTRWGAAVVLGLAPSRRPRGRGRRGPSGVFAVGGDSVWDRVLRARGCYADSLYPGTALASR
eukprot:8083727-Lingulodinium_polyedra.AAC.1